MYFLTVGFPKWDGYGVYHDPEVSTYISKIGEYIQPPPPGMPPYLPIIIVAVIVVAGAATALLLRKRVTRPTKMEVL